MLSMNGHSPGSVECNDLEIGDVLRTPFQHNSRAAIPPHNIVLVSWFLVMLSFVLTLMAVLLLVFGEILVACVLCAAAVGMVTLPLCPEDEGLSIVP